MRRRAASSLFLTVVASVALAACGADPGATAPAATVAPVTTSIASPATTGAPATTAATTIAAVVPDSLQFSADLVGGGQIDFRKYAGQTLALWFWAPT